MAIELTPDQAEAVAGAVDSPVAVIDPRSHRTYRLVPEEIYMRIEKILYNDSPWSAAEMAALAGAAFSKLDDTDYSQYLSNSQ
jgi:hypothetical protein